MLPIVLHHGLFGFANVQLGALKWSYFHRIDTALARRGNPLILSRVHPTGSIAKRAEQLKRTILDQLQQLGMENQRVVILGHSMGGLDARYMIHQLGMADRVAALLTVTTPHRGSPYADWAMKHLGQRLGGLAVMEFLGLDVQGIADLTTDACAEFNQRITDVPGVRYFSVSCARPWNLITPLLLPAYQVIHEAEGDNDGLVSLASAQWGQHLETWPADHLHSINKRFVIEIKHPTGNITPYYLRAIDAVIEACGHRSA